MRDALATVDGISDVDCDISTNVCTFKAPKDLDIEAKLNEIVASGNSHVKGWSRKTF